MNDHFGPTVRSRRGNRWLLVVVDIHTKYVLLHPCKSGKAREVVKLLEEEIFLKLGVPKIVLLDNARALVGRSMSQLLRRFNVGQWTTSYYTEMPEDTAAGNVDTFGDTEAGCMSEDEAVVTPSTPKDNTELGKVFEPPLISLFIV